MESSDRQKGRKKLVPTISREQACPHTYQEEDELRLEIDCTSCPGPQDVANRRCMTGMINILCSEAVPQTLILKRHIHKRYREAVLETTFRAANRLSVLNRAISNTEGASDTRCRTCRVSVPNTAAFLRHALLDDPVGYIERQAALVEEARARTKGIGCERARDCAEEALALVGLPDQGTREARP